MKLTNRFEELKKLTAKENWDFEKGSVICADDWDTAQRFCQSIRALRPDSPEPFPSPCGDGSIHLTWNRQDGAKFTIEWHSAYRYWHWSRSNGASDTFGTGTGQARMRSMVLSFLGERA